MEVALKNLSEMTRKNSVANVNNMNFREYSHIIVPQDYKNYKYGNIIIGEYSPIIVFLINV